VAAALTVACLAVAGCSGSGGDKAQSEDTITSTTPVTGVNACEDVEPGVVVDRTLAVIHFSPESICPGWVTVEQGTQVTFTNDDSVTRTVVITATQLPDSAEVARFTLAPGASQPFDTLDVAMRGFSTDAQPGFRGTIEVVAPGGGMSH
jgi:plastocyanin